MEKKILIVNINGQWLSFYVKLDVEIFYTIIITILYMGILKDYARGYPNNSAGINCHWGDNG